VGEGNESTPAVIVDRAAGTCQRIGVRAPIRVLDWTHDGKSFLFEETNKDNETGTYRYDIASHSARLVAIGTGAAVFVGDDDILALGNSTLNFRKIRNAPMEPTRAEIAVSNERNSEVEVDSLGFNTTPAMLAESRMIYATENHLAAITTFTPTRSGPIRQLIT